MMAPFAALLGLAGGAALVLAIAAATGRVREPAASVERPLAERVARINVPRTAVAVATGLLVFAMTGWPVAGVIVVLAWAYVPRVLSGGAAPADPSQIEAIASWAEMLRDTLAAAGGLQQSIVATAPVAPAAIRPQLLALSERLVREPMGPALQRLADELDDPTADLVVAALLLAADRSPRQLAPLLGSLAAQARADVASRLRVEAGRARTRSSVRIITLITIGFAFGLVILNPAYVAAYDDAPGQVTLVVISALFAGGLTWIGRAAHADRPSRFLTLHQGQR